MQNTFFKKPLLVRNCYYPKLDQNKNFFVSFPSILLKIYSFYNIQILTLQ